MKKQITYTSTLPDDLISQVNEYAEKYQMTKNKVIEEALRQYFFDQKRKEYEESFARIANDPEVVELAEMGMEDWAELVRKYENDEL
jgi:predicted transcriptional regulator